MPGLLRELEDGRVVVASIRARSCNRVWVTDRAGLVGEPVSLPKSRGGIERLRRLVGGGDAVFAVEATGALHRAWAAELERRWPGALRLFAPSETRRRGRSSATRRFKTDDRDCAALVWLARQGAGRPARPRGWRRCGARSRIAASWCSRSSRCVSACMISSTRSRPGSRRRPGTAGALALDTPTGRAVLACAAAFAGRAPSAASLKARAGGRLTDATAAFWAAALEGLPRAAAPTPSCAPRGSRATSTRF